MDRNAMIKELAGFAEVAPEAVRDTLVRELLKRLPDTALLEVYQATIGDEPCDGHSEPEETCEACNGGKS